MLISSKILFPPSLQFERSLGPGWWLEYWANSQVAVGVMLSGIRGAAKESVQCCAASEISLMWRWPCSGLQDRTPQVGLCTLPVLSKWLRLCLLSPGEAFWEFSAVRGRGKKALLCLPQFVFTWRMRFVPIKPQVFLNSLHSGNTCEQTDKMGFPLGSGDSPPPVHFEVYKWCSSVCPVCFVLCRWWFHLNWCWCLCLGTSFCSGVSWSGWRGTEGDCRPSCAELGLLESAFSAAWELLGCVNVALASCLETEGAARDSSWQWVPAAGSVDSSWMGC